MCGAANAAKKHKVAPGPSRLTNDHLRQMFPPDSADDDPNLGLLVAFVNKVLAGVTSQHLTEVDAKTIDWLCASNLVVLLKLDAAGNPKTRPDGLFELRPIAIPETLYRLVALSALHVLMPRITKLLETVQQLGVGVPGGVEAIATAIRLYLEDPDDLESGEELLRVIYQVDFVNAFNSIDRATCIQVVADELPELLPFVRCAYGCDARLVWSSRGKGNTTFRVFLSRTGVRQGDPLGPALFALGYLVALRKTFAAHPGAQLPSFLDDTSIIGSHAASSAVFATLKAASEEIGLEVNGTKSYAYSSNCDVSELPLPASITASPDGVVALGVPVGGLDFIRVHARKRLSAPLAQIRSLPGVSNAQCSLLVLRKSLVPRPYYLMAAAGMAALAPVLGEWDRGIADATCSMLGGWAPSRSARAASSTERGVSAYPKPR